MPVLTQTRRMGPPVLVSGTYDEYVPGTGKSYHYDCIEQSYLADYQSTTSYRSGRQYQQYDEELSGEKLARTVGDEYHARYDTGHEFSTRREGFRNYNLNSTLVKTSPTITATYHGPVTLTVSGDSGPQFSWSKDEQSSSGRAAIAATIPTAPEAGLAQFVGELREGLPKLIGLKSYKEGIRPATAGDEYLNLEFGLKPFINDIEKMARSISHAHRLARNYRLNSGKIVRRRRVLREDSVFVDLGKISGVSYRIATSIYVNRSSTRVDLTPTYIDVTGVAFSSYDVIHTRETFSGAYTYHLSEAHNFLGKMDRYEQLANHLLGTRITLDTIWELTPWTWLLDWFSDIGTFVKNVTLLHDDSTVLRYGYLMRETHATRTHIAKGLQNKAYVSGVPSLLRCDYEVVDKQRVKSTPYGFGIDLGSLSPRRWAILGALGMTKGPTTLR